MKKIELTRRQFLGAIGATVAAGSLAACGSSSADSSSQDSSQSAAQDASQRVDLRVAAASGPTAMGLVNMMNDTTGVVQVGADPADESDDQKSYDDAGVHYVYTISSTPDEIVAKVVAGQTDIACVPSNVASVLYNKTNGNVQVIDINTLGVLSVVTGDSSIKSFTDLAGHTVYISGKGASPEYTMNYLMDKAGIADKVTLEFMDQHAEVAAQLSNDPNSIGILPQPFTTATIAKNSAVQSVISLNDVWDQYAENGAKFVMGVAVVNKDYASQYPDAVSDFLQKHESSINAINSDPQAGGELVAQAGVVARAQIATKAIPNCSMTFIQGSSMKEGLSGYLQVLYDADPSSVGGSMPGDDFYYGA